MEKGAVVITGASTGIGASTAEYLVRQGYQVFGSVRRAPDGDALRNQLGDAFTPLIFDVTDGEAIAAGAADGPVRFANSSTICPISGSSSS